MGPEKHEKLPLRKRKGLGDDCLDEDYEGPIDKYKPTEKRDDGT